MVTLINDLFINSLIMISAVTLSNMLIRDYLYKRTLKNSLINGALSGILGGLLMIYSVSISPHIILDLRWIPIMLMGLYVSFAAAMETALIIALLRLGLNGIHEASIVAIFMALLVGLGCGLIGRMGEGTCSRRPMNNKATKWGLATLWTCMVVSAGYAFLIRDAILLRNLLLVFTVGMIFLSTLMYVFIGYIQAANRSSDAMKEASTRDYLTGLYNFRYFDESFNQLLEQVKSKKESLSLLFIDIDNFKKVNDVYGHMSGDTVLRELGGILTALARCGDIVTRKGGEEFTMLLAGCTLEDAAAVAERIRSSVESHLFRAADGKNMNITLSIGVACFPETTRHEEKLMEEADIALYRAKRSGRNRVALAG